MTSSLSQPDFSAAISRIRTMNSEELQQMLDSESKCDEFVKSLDQIRQLYAEKEILLASNKSLAEFNLEREPVLKEKRRILQEKHRELAKKAEKVRLLKRDVAEKSGKAAEPEDLLALLQVNKQHV